MVSSQAWIRNAFAGRRLERIAISGRTEEHFCPHKIATGQHLSSSFGTQRPVAYLPLNFVAHVSEMASERSPLPCLTSLVLEGVEFTGDVQQFEDVVQPFSHRLSNT